MVLVYTSSNRDTPIPGFNLEFDLVSTLQPNVPKFKCQIIRNHKLFFDTIIHGPFLSDRFCYDRFRWLIVYLSKPISRWKMLLWVPKFVLVLRKFRCVFLVFTNPKSINCARCLPNEVKPFPTLHVHDNSKNFTNNIFDVRNIVFLSMKQCMHVNFVKYLWFIIPSNIFSIQNSNWQIIIYPIFSFLPSTKILIYRNRFKIN